MADVQALVDVLTQFMTKMSQGSTAQTNADQTASHQSTASDILANQTLTFESFEEEKETFTAYRQRLENFFSIKRIDGNTEECKKAQSKVLINCLGSKHYQLLCSLTAPEVPTSKTYDELIGLLQSHLCPSPTPVIEQHKFLSRMQSPNETVAQYVAALRQLTTTCEFNCPSNNCGVSIANVFLRAQFIRGLSDPHMREKLLQIRDLTFERAVEVATSVEASQIGNRVIAGGAGAVNKVQQERGNKFKPHYKHTQARSHSTAWQNKSADSRYQQNNRSSRSTHFRAGSTKRKVNYRELGIDGLCLKCGLNSHKSNECRRNRNSLKCSLCSKVGHISKVCITSLTKSRSRQSPNIRLLNSSENDDIIHNENINVNRIIDIRKTDSSSDFEKFIVPIKVGSKVINFEVDTGSPVTLINSDDFSRLNINCPLQKTNVVFRAYTNETFAPLGMLKVPVSCGQYKSVEDLYVVPAPYAAIAGRVWLRHLNIVNIRKNLLSQDSPNVISQVAPLSPEKLKQSILSQYEDVFQEKVGCVPNFKCTLRLKTADVCPVFLKPRPIPYSLQSKVESELEMMEKAGIIEKVHYSEWGSPLVCVPKPDGNVRLCVDYKATVNPHLQDVRYTLPLIDDVLNSLRGSKVFCLLDIHKAYQHLTVDEESEKLQTISTHKGTYRMKRLAFGIKTAPNEFQKFLDTTLQGLEGVTAYFDDIAVHADSLEKCHSRLIKCLNRLKEANLHLNRNKCKLFASEISYLGHIVNAEGIQKSPDKVEAIIKAPRPKNISEVRSFIGYVSYYSKFLPNITETMHPIYQLLRRNEPFKWTPTCEAAFTKIKQQIASDTVLVKYDPKLPLILATDASPIGISAVLSHKIDGEERPIMFASRSLSKSEQRYSQLDREATAVYWAFRKFFMYIYGRKFTLLIDNKPLSYIFDSHKRLPTITASRLIRYAMFLSGFDYEIQHRRSNEHANADYLSRAPLKETQITETQDEDYQIYNIAISQISTETVTFKSIQEETENDEKLRKLKNDLMTGKNDSPEFSLHEGVIFRGTRVVIPSNLQKAVLNELHSVHQGIVKMKSLARRFCYWKNIDADIEHLVKSCRACADIKSSPPKVPLHTWETPEEVWERIHMDYAGPFQGHYFFIVVDAKSKWPEILVSKNAPTTASTITHLQEIFSRNGLPEILASDNATIFTSNEFREFCSRNGIRQCFIAPGHPATNGQAERFVQTLKRKLKSMANEPGTISSKLYEILLRYRATPIVTTDKTPAEVFVKRNLRTRLDLLKMKPLHRSKSENPIVNSDLRLGERVQSRNYTSSQNWKYGTVVEKLGRLHYLIELDDGYVIKRHRNQLRKTEVPKKREDTNTRIRQSPNTEENNPEHSRNMPKHQDVSPESRNRTSIQQPDEAEEPNSEFQLSQESENEVPPGNVNVNEDRVEPSNKSPVLRRSARIRKPVIRLNL